MPHADPARRQEYNRDYKRKNRHRYRGRQKVYDAAKHANERAARHGRPGTITPEDVDAVLDGAICAYCGATDRLTIDHRIGLHDPRSTNERSNLVPACHSCNASKHQADEPHVWSRKHGAACVQCGSSDHPHVARGLCSPCYWSDYEARHPGRRSKN